MILFIISIMLISCMILGLVFTWVGIFLKDYCPLPLNLFNIILIIAGLSILHTYFLIPFIIYIIIGYFISIKWYNEYWKNGNILKLPHTHSIQGFVMVCDMIFYWPIYFFKKLPKYIKTPFSEAAKINDL